MKASKSTEELNTLLQLFNNLSESDKDNFLKSLANNP